MTESLNNKLAAYFSYFFKWRRLGTSDFKSKLNTRD